MGHLIKGRSAGRASSAFAGLRGDRQIMRTVVLGGTGFLGAAVFKRLEDLGHVVDRTGSAQLDLLMPQAADVLVRRLGRLDRIGSWEEAGRLLGVGAA